MARKRKPDLLNEYTSFVQEFLKLKSNQSIKPHKSVTLVVERNSEICINDILTQDIKLYIFSKIEQTPLLLNLCIVCREWRDLILGSEKLFDKISFRNVESVSANLIKRVINRKNPFRFSKLDLYHCGVFPSSIVLELIESNNGVLKSLSLHFHTENQYIAILSAITSEEELVPGSGRTKLIELDFRFKDKCKRLPELLKNKPTLEILRIRGTIITEELLLKLSKSVPNLKILDLTEATFGEKVHPNIFLNWNKLECLIVMQPDVWKESPENLSFPFIFEHKEFNLERLPYLIDRCQFDVDSQITIYPKLRCANPLSLEIYTKCPPLFFSCIARDISWVMYCLEKGTATDNTSKCLTLMVTMESLVEDKNIKKIIKLLLDFGANPLAKPLYPLEVACEYGQYETVVMLLNYTNLYHSTRRVEVMRHALSANRPFDPRIPDVILEKGGLVYLFLEYRNHACYIDTHTKQEIKDYIYSLMESGKRDPVSNQPYVSPKQFIPTGILTFGEKEIELVKKYGEILFEGYQTWKWPDTSNDIGVDKYFDIKNVDDLFNHYTIPDLMQLLFDGSLLDINKRNHAGESYLQNHIGRITEIPLRIILENTTLNEVDSSVITNALHFGIGMGDRIRKMKILKSYDARFT